MKTNTSYSASQQEKSMVSAASLRCPHPHTDRLLADAERIKLRRIAAPIAAALLLLGSAVVADAGLLTQTVFGGAGDQQGTGVAVSGGNVYYAGTSAAANDGILGRYNGALTTPSWSQTLGGTFGNLYGVAVGNTVYTAGSARSPLTTDTVGGAENKSVTASIGLGGGAFNWRTQTPAAPGFFSYGGTEISQGMAISTSAGVDTVYTVGFGQSNGAGSGYGMTVGKVSQAGGVAATATYAPGIGTFGTGITTLGGNVFAVGSTGANALIRAYDGNLGSLWSEGTLAGSYNNVAAYNGDIYAVGVNGANGILSRYNAITGARLWTQSYAGDVLNGIVGVGGVLYAVGSTGSDALLLGLDAATGAVQTTQTFGGAGTDVFNDITLNTVDNTLYAVGTTDSASLGANGQDVWLAQFSTPSPVPEPATMAVGLLCLGAGVIRRRRRVTEGTAV